MKPSYYEDERLSQSMLKAYLKCPNYYKAKYIDKTIEEEMTDAMTLGKVVDCLITCPQDFDEQYEVVKRKKKDGGSKTQISVNTFEKAAAMSEKVSRQPVMEMFDWCENQVELYTDKQKALLDYFGVRKSSAVIADLKTVPDINKIRYSMEDYGYYFQLAYYKMLAKAVYPKIRTFKCYIIAIDKTKDMKFCVYEVDQRRLKSEETLVRQAMRGIENMKRFATGICHTCPASLPCQYSLFTKSHIEKL